MSDNEIEEIPCQYGHTCLIPEISKGKSLLRTDGVYVQFGSRIWYTAGGRDTSDHWYNLIYVLDNKNMVTLGLPMLPFYD